MALNRNEARHVSRIPDSTMECMMRSTRFWKVLVLPPGSGDTYKAKHLFTSSEMSRQYSRFILRMRLMRKADLPLPRPMYDVSQMYPRRRRLRSDCGGLINASSIWSYSLVRISGSYISPLIRLSVESLLTGSVGKGFSVKRNLLYRLSGFSSVALGRFVNLFTLIFSFGNVYCNDVPVAAIHHDGFLLDVYSICFLRKFVHFQ